MDDVEYSEFFKAKCDLEEHEWFLDNIGFELNQLEEVREMYQNKMFDNGENPYEETVKLLLKTLKESKDAYERKYGLPANIEDAKGVFTRNRRDASKEGGAAGNTDKIYPIPKQQDMGIQAW